MVFKNVDGNWTLVDLHKEFPNTSFSEDHSVARLPDGYMWLQPTTPPTYSKYECVKEVAPEIINGVLTQQWRVEQVSEKEARELFKADRQALVDSIVVEVGGKLFDGDEKSQDRMTRAISVLLEGETVQWVLADNSVVQCNKAELVQALRLSGEKQTSVWIMPE